MAFATFNSLIFILLLHLGCFFAFYTTRRHPKPPRKPPSPITHKPHNPISSSWSFIKQIFSPNKPDPIDPTRPGLTRVESGYVPLRNENELNPCPSCGEVFNKPGLLQQHESTKHPVREMSDQDPGKDVVRMIFESGWPVVPPTVRRVMKIHNSPKILARFEEYRESVKVKAARFGGRQRDERCVADGNELLRFYCTTFMCDLGQNGSICTQPYCGVCGIISSGFSPKLDGIPTLPNSWRGHVSVPEDIEEEFQFMGVKRAMLVCRVIAGRVGCDPGMGDKNDPGYDSLVGRGSGAVQSRVEEEDELIVFNPRAVLPCFVIVYTV